MTCAEFHQAVAAFALRALDPAEHAECQAHIEAAGPHHGCHEALIKARAVAAELARALPSVSPGPNVWAALEIRLKAVTAGTGAHSARLLRELAGWFVAAAVLGFHLSPAAAAVAPDASGGARRGGLGRSPRFEHQLVPPPAYYNPVARDQVAGQDLLGQGIAQAPLDAAFDWAGAERRIVALRHQ